MPSVPRRQRTRREADDEQLVIRLTYGRVSKREMADDGLSLENQLRRCRSYNAELPCSIVGDEFVDVESGRVDERADYQRMLLVVKGHALAGRRVSVTVIRLDRLGRKASERLRMWDALTELGVEIHSLADGGLQNSKLVYTILAGVAEEESRLIGERVCDVFDGLEELGWHKPGRAPWGYQWRPATPAERADGSPKTVLEPHPVEREYAAEALTRYANGASCEAVCRWAAALPIDARGGPAEKGGRALKGSAVRQVLRSPVYVGRTGGPHDFGACVERGDRCAVVEQKPGRWEPLVSDAVWIALHGQYRTHKRLPVQASGEYLLTGLLRCWRCGGRMTGNPGNRTRAIRDGVTDLTTVRRYVCSSRLHGDAEARANPCYASLHAVTVERQVVDQIGLLLELLDDAELQAAMRAYGARRQREQRAEPAARRIGQLTARLPELRRELAATTRNFGSGQITKLAYDVTVATIQDELDATEAELTRLRQTARREDGPAVETLIAGMTGWAASWRDAALAAKRPVLAQLVERGRPIRRGHGRYDVVLDLTAVGRKVLEWVCAADEARRATAGDSVVQHIATAMCRTTLRGHLLGHGSGHAVDHASLTLRSA